MIVHFLANTNVHSPRAKGAQEVRFQYQAPSRMPTKYLKNTWQRRGVGRKSVREGGDDYFKLSLKRKKIKN